MLWFILKDMMLKCANSNQANAGLFRNRLLDSNTNLLIHALLGRVFSIKAEQSASPSGEFSDG